MRLYVFVFESAESTVDFETGFDIQPSFAFKTASFDEAVKQLANQQPLDGSNDPEDYMADIMDGNIQVHIPSTYEIA